MEPHIVFDNQNHSYIRTKDNTIYTSGTTLIKKYSQPFNSDFWTLYKTYEAILDPFQWNKAYLVFKVHGQDAFKEYVNNTYGTDNEIKGKQTILNMDWGLKKDTSATAGTSKHFLHEFKWNSVKSIKFGDYTVLNGRLLFHELNYDNWSLVDNLKDLPDGYYTEFLIFNDEYEIAGQIDLLIVLTIKNVRYVYLYDYKTNEKIKQSQYSSTGEKVVMKHPLTKYFDVNYTHYRLQLNLYSWMLEEHGFKTKVRQIQHIGFEPMVKYDIKTMKDIPTLLKHYNANYRQRA